MCIVYYLMVCLVCLVCLGVIEMCYVLYNTSHISQLATFDHNARLTKFAIVSFWLISTNKATFWQYITKIFDVSHINTHSPAAWLNELSNDLQLKLLLFTPLFTLLLRGDGDVVWLNVLLVDCERLILVGLIKLSRLSVLLLSECTPLLWSDVVFVVFVVLECCEVGVIFFFVVNIVGDFVQFNGGGSGNVWLRVKVVNCGVISHESSGTVSNNEIWDIFVDFRTNEASSLLIVIVCKIGLIFSFCGVCFVDNLFLSLNCVCNVSNCGVTWCKNSGVKARFLASNVTCVSVSCLVSVGMRLLWKSEKVTSKWVS